MATLCLRPVFLTAIVAVAGVSMAQAEPSRADLAQKQAVVADKRFQAEKKEYPVRSRLMERRFSVETWHARYNSIGRRRASIQVEEGREKRMVRPDVQTVERVDWGLARQSGRTAYVRNFDRLRDVPSVRRYEEADVGAVRRDHADVRVEGEGFSMRDINRFAFQRNHSSDEGLSAVTAGEGDSGGAGDSRNRVRND